MNPSLIECANTTVLDCEALALDPDSQTAGDDAGQVKGCREDNSRHFFGTTGSSVAEFPSPAGHELQSECALHDPIADLPRFLSWTKTKRHATGEHYLIKSQDGCLLGLRYACDVPGKSKNMDSAQWDVEKLQWRVGGFFLKSLYGLEHLQSKPDAKVLIVAGEKTCEAARALFPDMVVLALMGTRSEQKVDLDPVLARTVIIWPDADPDGIDAARTLAARLHKKRPKGSLQNATTGQGFQLPVKRPGSVSLVELPDTLLSWMKAGSTEPGCWNLSEPVPEGVDIRAILNDAKPWKQCGPDPQAKDCDLPNQAGGYLIFDKRICIEKNGEPQPLAGFTARIREELLLNDGESRECFFVIEGKPFFGPPFPLARVSAANFNSMNWVTTQWGAEAVIYAGSACKDHLRTAIMMLSRPIKRTEYLHSGWIHCGQQWLFLHAGGAIGPEGLIDSPRATVQGNLRNYRLPDALKGEPLAHAIRTSLRILDLGPIEITAPVWLTAFRATLDESPLSLHLSGQPNQGKTELAAMAAGHFVPLLDSKRVPLESWESSITALEIVAFQGKDVVGIIDDFRPQGTQTEVAKLQKIADRLLRGAFNRATRNRAECDAKNLKGNKLPRGLIISTGEDLPDGESLRSRVLCMEWPTGAMNWSLLRQLQHARGEGVYAGLMSAFIAWQARHRERVLDMRKMACQEASQKLWDLRNPGSGGGNRTGEIACELWSAWPVIKAFAVEERLLTGAELALLEARIWNALLTMIGAQASLIQQANPVTQFRDRMAACLASGRANLAHGDLGALPALWKPCCGWFSEEEPKTLRLGYISPIRREVWLIPDVAYQEAGRMGTIAISQDALWKKMAESGWLLLERKDRYRARRRDANLPPSPNRDDRPAFIVMSIDKLWPSAKDDELEVSHQGQLEDIGTVQNNLSQTETHASAASGSDGTPGTLQNPNDNHALASMDWKDEWGAELPFG